MELTTNNIYETIPLDDQKTYEEIFWTGKTVGVFQLEKKWAGKICAELKPENIHHIAALLALLRPGAMNFKDENGISTTKHYILRKNNLEESKSWHPSVDELLKDTYYVMAYQEQMMAIARKLAGFDLVEVDRLRKAAGKKNAQEMTEILKIFVDKAEKVGIVTRDEAQTIADGIKESARYLFNAAHSYGYGIRTFTSAYLKCHYRLPWFVAWLKGCDGDKESIAELVEDAISFEINVYPPCIVESDIQFQIINKKDIIFGLGDISGIGAAQAKTIKDDMDRLNNLKPLREYSWYDFLINTNISVSVIKKLIDCGALRKISADRKRLSFEAVQYYSLNEKERAWCRQNQGEFNNLLDLLNAAARTKKEGGACHNKNRVSIVRDVIAQIQNPPMDLKDYPREIVANERELLGISLTCDTLDKYKHIQTSTLEEFLDDLIGDSLLKFVVEIESLRLHQCKNGASAGENMAFAKIKDKTGSVDAVIFPDTLKDLTKDKTIYEGACVLVECSRSTSKDERYKKSLIINGAQRI